MQVISAVAEFERGLLVKRTNASLARAKAAGKRFGRPPSLTEEQKQAVFQLIDAGESVSAIARRFDVTQQTIMRVRTSRILKSNDPDCF